MEIAFSPCPNDTFIFNDLVSDKDINAHLYDVETLNRMAFEEKFDLTKLSFYAWLLVKDKYHLLMSVQHWEGLWTTINSSL